MTLYYQDDAVALWHGDWRELIGDLRADCIVTDPPYAETSLEWDQWPAGWPSLAARHSTSMWCFGSMRMFLDRRDEFPPWKLSQDVVWEKHNGSGFRGDRFRRIHEHALHWYQGDWAAVRHETPRTGRDRRDRRINRGTTPHLDSKRGRGVIEGQTLMPSVLYCPSMHGNAINETEKPTSILEHLIAYACPPDGTVIDLYAGSGSALLAARNTGRRAVGYELRESQCEKAARWLSQGVLDFAPETPAREAFDTTHPGHTEANCQAPFCADHTPPHPRPAMDPEPDPAQAAALWASTNIRDR